MSLANALVTHRDRILADLDAAHDYYVNSIYSWRFLLKAITNGRRVRIQNKRTRNTTTQVELPDLIKSYVKDNLASSTYQQFVSLFEDFLFGLMRLWLQAYPHSLAKKQLPVSAVLEATDLESLKLVAVNREVNELNYRKLREWFAYLDGLAKLGCPSLDVIDRLAEIKAARDVHVHNRGIANTVYVEKSGALRRCQVGERLPLPEAYHYESWELIRKVVADVSSSAISKAAIVSPTVPLPEVDE